MTSRRKAIDAELDRMYQLGILDRAYVPGRGLVYWLKVSLEDAKKAITQPDETK
jgi:hypothetical protein